MSLLDIGCHLWPCSRWAIFCRFFCLAAAAVAAAAAAVVVVVVLFFFVRVHILLAVFVHSSLDQLIDDRPDGTGFHQGPPKKKQKTKQIFKEEKKRVGPVFLFDGNTQAHTKFHHLRRSTSFTTALPALLRGVVTGFYQAARLNNLYLLVNANRVVARAASSPLTRKVRRTPRFGRRSVVKPVAFLGFAAEGGKNEIQTGR